MVTTLRPEIKMSSSLLYLMLTNLLKSKQNPDVQGTFIAYVAVYTTLMRLLQSKCPYAYPRKAEGNYHFCEHSKHSEAFFITKI